MIKLKNKIIKIYRELNYDKDYRLKYLWNGLDILHPDFDERMQRIRDFNDDWFSKEIILGRKTYEDSREWLKGLKE